MKRKFCCDSSRGMYEDYYMNQSGSGMPVFAGYRGQRGHGLGSMLSGLFRSAMPMIRRGLAFFGRQALRTGAQIANDVADGESIGNSAKRRVSEGIKRFDPSELFSTQSGSGKRKSKRRKPSKKRKASKRNKHGLF